MDTEMWSSDKDLGKEEIGDSSIQNWGPPQLWNERAGKCQCLRKHTRERSGRKPVIEKSQELASLKPKEEKSINREQENARAHQPRNLMEMAGRAGRLIKSSTDGAWK